MREGQWRAVGGHINHKRLATAGEYDNIEGQRNCKVVDVKRCFCYILQLNGWLQVDNI